VKTGFLAEATASVALAVSAAADFDALDSVALGSDGGSDCSRLLLFAAIVAIAQNCCVSVDPGGAPKNVAPAERYLSNARDTTDRHTLITRHPRTRE